MRSLSIFLSGVNDFLHGRGVRAGLCFDATFGARLTRPTRIYGTHR